jgi:AraC-like DNA-binding protein
MRLKPVRNNGGSRRLRHVEFADRRIVSGHTWNPPAGLSPALRCALEIQDPAHARPRRIQHAQWALECARTSGQEVAFSRCAPAWQRLAPGEVFLYPPGSVHWERLRSPGPSVRVRFILFEGGEAAGLRSLFTAGATWVRFEDIPEGIAGWLDRMAAVGTQREDAGFWDAQAGLCYILSQLLRSVPAANPHTRRLSDAAPDESSDLVRTVRGFLQTHMVEAISLGALARHSRVSLSTLTHEYRRETGETPMQTLAQLRLNQVKGLLLRRRRLKEIAELTGFADAFHVSRFFKRLTGQSPRQFRNQVR